MDRLPKIGRSHDVKETQKAYGIVGYIETHFLGNNASDDASVSKMKKRFASVSPEEKALTLFQNLVTYLMQYKEVKKQGGTVADLFAKQMGVFPKKKRALQNIASPDLVAKIKVLWGDANARKIFIDAYGSALSDMRTFKVSALGRELRDTENNIAQKEVEYKKLKQALTLAKVANPLEKGDVEFELQCVAEDLVDERSTRDKIVRLDGQELIQENTDVAARMMFDTLARYRNQAEEGFAWLPSRLALHRKIIDLMQNTGKAPLLIGPPGTGKTTQLDAVANELTGQPTIRIPCSNSLGDEGLVAKRDFKSGEGAYDYTGCIAEAYTGFSHSNDTEPTHPSGRIVNLDEVSQLNLDRALGPLKDVRQAKQGRPLNRYVKKNVLPGAGLSATSNIPITDERLDREFGRVPTNYFEMKNDNPELLEFMLAKLLNADRSFPVIDRNELAPAYKKVELPDSTKTLSDGSRIIAEDHLIADTTSVEHGFLYRLAYAIRTLQDSYIHGSKFNEKHLAGTALFSDINDKGETVITGFSSDFKEDPTGSGATGEMLKLTAGTSTITPDIISRWIDGFKKRMNSTNKADRVATLTQWLQMQLNNHIYHTSPEDGDKIKAIFNHWHLFDEVKPARPSLLTPKDVGYLSPRVPRPLYTEKPPEVPKDETPVGIEATDLRGVEAYTTTDVSLDSGERVKIKKADFSGATLLSDTFMLAQGRRFRIDGNDYLFAGECEGKNDGMQLASESMKEKGLHSLFDKNAIELGIIEFDFAKIEKSVGSLCRREKEKQKTG